MTSRNSFETIICVALATSAILSYGCGKAEDDPSASSSETVSEIAASSMSGAVQSSDANGAVAFSLESSPSRLAKFEDLFALFPNAFAATVCAPANLSTGCTNGVITATYANCSFTNSAAVWNGSQIITFNTPSSCPALGHMYDSGNVFTRSFGAATTRLARDVTVAFDTAVPLKAMSLSNAGSPAVAGGGTQITMGTGTRTINIMGIHYTATKNVTTNKGNIVTKTVWEHIVDTPTPLVVNKSGTTHTVASGTMRVQHLKAGYTATASPNGVTYDTSIGCCHPKSGTLTSTYTNGSLYTAEVLTFASTSTACGAASIQVGTGSSSAAALAAAQAATGTGFTMSHCF